MKFFMFAFIKLLSIFYFCGQIILYFIGCSQFSGTPAVKMAGYQTAFEWYCREEKGIRGVTIGIIEDKRGSINSYGSKEYDWALEEIKDTGANWVALTPYGTMISCNDTKVFSFFELPSEESERMLVTGIRHAKEAGFKVMIAPHIYPWDWCWRGEINPGGGEFENEKGWNDWFDSYGAYLNHIAKISAREGVEMLSVGVEFKSASNKFGYRFSKIISDIREIFPGRLTYSANWDEVKDVTFWSDLDFIGVNAFYPMSDSGSSSPDEIYEKALNIAEELKEISLIYNKPVIFTEIGFKALRGSLKEPWIWPEYVTSPVIDDDIQALLFDTVFSVFWTKEWFAGLFIWRYMADPSDYSQEPPWGYLVRLKPAEKVIKNWFICGNTHL